MPKLKTAANSETQTQEMALDKFENFSGDENLKKIEIAAH
jgi:hypothetical protein